ncbi:hypothetical protein FVF58_17210 [Paraburkholderia panacisoli]|uniref:Uncharacterized protein n=1 Tax=Paraburkholderia panacisoli TaxID=2603818 RepID=A0A5B0H855_9BURK|nr:hypothetical protein [Paraburkholderia panacisoli]KAA1011224.1 hypothetical protein FVF58_17210 [Paraburkholderia panacisoli]
MDDRFDRRELLLHLGDMLGALNCLASTSEAGASEARLIQKEDSLQHFEFLRALAPQMTVSEFTRGVGRAFFLWPKELLEAELNRDALASTVQQHLFDGNPDGWNAYISYVQKKVKWFGASLSDIKQDAPTDPSHDATDESSPLEAPVTAVPPVGAEVQVRNEKRGWPWPEPRSTS